MFCVLVTQRSDATVILHTHKKLFSLYNPFPNNVLKVEKVPLKLDPKTYKDALQKLKRREKVTSFSSHRGIKWILLV